MEVWNAISPTRHSRSRRSAMIQSLDRGIRPRDAAFEVGGDPSVPPAFFRRPQYRDPLQRNARRGCPGVLSPLPALGDRLTGWCEGISGLPRNHCCFKFRLDYGIAARFAAGVCRALWAGAQLAGLRKRELPPALGHFRSGSWKHENARCTEFQTLPPIRGPQAFRAPAPP